MGNNVGEIPFGRCGERWDDNKSKVVVKAPVVTSEPQQKASGLNEQECKRPRGGENNPVSSTYFALQRK